VLGLHHVEVIVGKGHSKRIATDEGDTCDMPHSLLLADPHN
jgi:hypothetical protein